MECTYIAEKPLGYQQFTCDVATGLNMTTLSSAGVSLILVVPQGQAVRWRDDGTDPTAAIGQPLAVGAELRYTGRNPAALKFIGQLAGATINATAYSNAV